MTKIKSVAFAGVGWLVLSVAACGSSDKTGGSGGGPLVAFQGSACKKEAGTGQALTSQEAYAGLSCVRWSPGQDGALHVELFNFEGGCGAEWKGESTLSDSGLELRVVNPECLLAACGSCIYDWAFDVRVPSDADLTVSIVKDPCPGQQTPETEPVTLPLSTTSQGELCRYADWNALGWQASSLATCGQAYMPCRTQNGMCSMGASTTECEAGLTCADGAATSQGVCHAPCQGDGDCVPAGILTCQSGLCRPAKPW